MKIAAFLALALADLIAAIPNLSDGAAAEALKQEKAAEKPRPEVIEALELDLAHRADRAREEAEKKAAEKAAMKGAGGEAPAAEIPVTDYRHRDYVGPLTGGQAAWRVANIKPVTTGVRTK